jgi:YebC/PmpR family DNA-binding regulatory protein
MSGHSKWKTIKRKKGALDQERGKIFTKLGKEISVAARLGGGSPEANARLRQAVLAARTQGMPKDNIERAIKKGTGELEGAGFEELVYEGYGPGGIAVLVEVTTDNKNRVVSDLRNLFRSYGGHLGESGSVHYLFTHHGHLSFDKSKWSEDQIMEVALAAGADDVTEGDGTIDVLTDPHDLYRVVQEFEKVGMHPAGAGFSYEPKSATSIGGEPARRFLSFVEELEDHEDVARIHSNFDMEPGFLAEAANG